MSTTTSYVGLHLRVEIKSTTNHKKVSSVFTFNYKIILTYIIMHIMNTGPRLTITTTITCMHIVKYFLAQYMYKTSVKPSIFISHEKVKYAKC